MNEADDRCEIMGRNGNPIARIGAAVQFVAESLERLKVGAMFVAQELSIEQILNLFEIVFDA